METIISTDSKNLLKPYDLEVWGGIECTINRVGDTFLDQLQCSGHYERENDIQEFAKLGIKALRYPVLWEKHQPVEDQTINWTWIEQQLNQIRKYNITPIAGLLHHGSGPAYTNLSDPDFPIKLAKYAKQVAEKFPWLQYYTPVNEPLTTARFSGLYGFWYPHKKNTHDFLFMLLQQIKGIVLSMQAIRKINPAAKLIQTEDLAKIHSTGLLRYQAKFENERRWLTYDLLCGKVDQQHSLWDYFITAGIEEKELLFFIDNKCVPDIIGCNYYVTSERYLDHNINNYPAHLHGGNGKHTYVDTEVVRVTQPDGLASLLYEVCERYQLPVTVTEAHLNCTREEQLRWIKEIWDTCIDLKTKGFNIKAVTVWALLGSYDWDSLLTKNNNNYESGIFSVANKKIHSTALANMVNVLSSAGNYSHPLLNAEGWWHTSYHYQPDKKNILNNNKQRPVLIIGKTGTLGNAFAKICEQRSIHFKLLSRNDLNICDEISIKNAIELYQPWAIINTAGYVKVDDAEIDADNCLMINARGPKLLSTACNQYGIKFMTFSSDMVFDGKKNAPYIETDPVSPLNIYGISKAEAEKFVLTICPSALIIRTSSFFGPWDKFNFVHTILQNLKDNKKIIVSGDVTISPTYVPDLVNRSIDALIDDKKGIVHFTNNGQISWSDFAEEIAKRGGFSKNNLIVKPSSDIGWKAQRPLYSALQNNSNFEFPTIDNALERFFKEERA